MLSLTWLSAELDLKLAAHCYRSQKASKEEFIVRRDNGYSRGFMEANVILSCPTDNADLYLILSEIL